MERRTELVLQTHQQEGIKNSKDYQFRIHKCQTFKAFFTNLWVYVYQLCAVFAEILVTFF